MQKILIAFYFLLLPNTSLSISNLIDYQKSRDLYFWKMLYVNGGSTLYCNQPFLSSNKGLNVEHVYPASWISSSFGCRSRKSCRDRRYHRASGDLHNLWPSRSDINKHRSNHPFGEIRGETYRIKTDVCRDFERKANLVEPQDSVKGDIARTVFYMARSYKLPLKMSTQLLRAWHKNDPVDIEEIRRNREIFKIQKRVNPYIFYKEEDGIFYSLEP